MTLTKRQGQAKRAGIWLQQRLGTYWGLALFFQNSNLMMSGKCLSFFRSYIIFFFQFFLILSGIALLLFSNRLFDFGVFHISDHVNKPTPFQLQPYQMVGERRISISTGPLCLAFPLRPPQSHLDPQTHIPPQTPPKQTYRPHPLKSDIKHIHTSDNPHILNNNNN